MKKIILIFMLLFLIGCEKENITIGMVGSLSGDYSEVGIAMRDGLLYKVEQINKSGGINGRTVEVLIRDDKGNLNLTEQYTEEFFELGVDSIFGYELSNKRSVVNQYKDKGTVIMSPTLSSHDLSDQDDYFYRTINTNYAQGEALASIMEKSYNNIVAIYDQRNEAFALGIIEGYEAVFGKSLESYGFNNYLIYYEDELIEMIGDAEAVVVILSPYDTLTLGQFIYKNDIDVQLYSSNWGIADDDYEKAGKALDGALFCSMLGAENTVDYESFRAGFEERFLSTPQFVAVYSYEAATMLFEAMENSESNFSDLKESLDQLESIKGVISELKFNDYGDIIRDLHFSVYQDGELINIE